MRRAYVVEAGSAIRCLPDEQSAVLARLEAGERVAVLDAAGEWMRVAAGSLEGYVRVEHLAMVDAAGRGGFLASDAALMTAPVAKPPGERLTAAPGATARERAVAEAGLATAACWPPSPSGPASTRPMRSP